MSKSEEHLQQIEQQIVELVSHGHLDQEPALFGVAVMSAEYHIFKAVKILSINRRTKNAIPKNTDLQVPPN